MKELIVSGDSWSFGSEIVDPLLPSDIDELSEKNDSYRLSHIWPNLLKDKLKFSELKNLSLTTSKTNYIDPRITIAFFKNHDLPLEKIFTKALIDKFFWAVDVPKDWQF